MTTIERANPKCAGVCGNVVDWDMPGGACVGLDTYCRTCYWLYRKGYDTAWESYRNVIVQRLNRALTSVQADLPHLEKPKMDRGTWRRHGQKDVDIL